MYSYQVGLDALCLAWAFIYVPVLFLFAAAISTKIAWTG